MRRLARILTYVLIALGTVAAASPILAAQTTPNRPAMTSATIVPRKSWPAPSPTPSPTAPPILLMSIGDSLTYGVDGSTWASYRLEVTRLLNLAGVPHTWNVQAVGGTKCHYWAGLIASLLDTYHPKVVFLDCGTNDDPTTDNTQADYTTILAAASSRNIKIVASLIGRPDPDGSANIPRWPTIDNWMDATNTAIRAALAAYPNVPVAPTLRVPNNAEWLKADGIHWTIRAETAVGQLFYQAAAPLMGWPSLTALKVREMCGLSGHDRDERWPTPDVAYYPCRSE